MSRARLIPVLLLKDGGLVKSIRFKDHRYIGDPLNAARIFNELRADELIFLDISASNEKRLISLEFVNSLAEELTMPFSVGGGIRSLTDIEKVMSAGVEKAVIGSRAVEHPDFVRLAATEFGSSTISVCIDIKKGFLGTKRVCTMNGQTKSHWDPVEFARLMASNGAGELIAQSIDRDGTMAGYDLDLVRSIADAVPVPVVALGGAGSCDDLMAGRSRSRASALAAGSLFVYQSTARGVLINYPEDKHFLSSI